MALRDRQISGVPLTKRQAVIVAVVMTAFVPAVSYGVWFNTILAWLPEELRLPLVIVGMIIHFTLSIEMVPNNVERNLLWFGSYTGASFPNGICLVPRLPVPVLLLALRLFLDEETYKKIFWSLEGDVSVQSIPVPYEADGLARGGIRVRIFGTLRVEVVNAATFRSQTMYGEDRLIAMIAAEYASGLKSAVIAQHTAAELQRGYHSAGSQALTEWMTEAWNLVSDFGVKLSRAPLVKVEILSKAVEHAFDLEHAQETFVAAAGAVGDAIAELKRKHPDLSETELAMIYPSVFGGTGNVSVNVHNVKLK